MFQGPTAMHAGRNGLEARLRPAGGPRSYVSASVEDGKLTGTFLLDVTEESAHCQTSDYAAAKPQVRFEAVRYEPAGSGATRPAAKGEIPVYYGNEDGVEVLFETLNGSVDFRGAAPAACPVTGKQPAGQRAPLFGDIEDARLDESNSFGRAFHRQGQIGDNSWSEATSISGAIEGGTISGTYSRTTITRTKKGSPQQCKTGPLAFSAARYLPALP